MVIRNIQQKTNKNTYHKKLQKENRWKSKFHSIGFNTNVYDTKRYNFPYPKHSNTIHYLERRQTERGRVATFGDSMSFEWWWRLEVSRRRKSTRLLRERDCGGSNRNRGSKRNLTHWLISDSVWSGSEWDQKWATVSGLFAHGPVEPGIISLKLINLLNLWFFPFKK